MTKLIAAFVAGVVVVLAGSALFSGGANLGGVYSQSIKDFREGITVGTGGAFSISSTGAVSVAGVQTVVDEFTQGGGVLALVDANGGTYTLTEAELLTSNYVSFTAGGAGQAVVALTLPATSTMTTLIASAGDCREWIYDASALAAATTTTITAGTGHDVIAYTTNDDVIDGNEFAIIKMCRQSDGDVTTFTSELLQAD